MIRHAKQRRRGFTIIDLLAVLAIVLFLMALLVPAVQRVREAAARTQTNNNLRQLGIALHNAEGAFKKMPPAFGAYGRLKEATIHIHLLPFDEQNPLYNSILEGGSTRAVVPQYIAPSDASVKGGGIGVQNFAANLRVFSDKGRKAKYDAKFDDLKGVQPCTFNLAKGFPDGTSNTIMFATKYAVCGEGGSDFAAEPTEKFAAFFGQNPAQKPAHPSDETATYQFSPSAKQCRISPLMPQSFGSAGLSVCMGDCVVRQVSPKVAAETWNRLVHPDDGKEIDDAAW